MEVQVEEVRLSHLAARAAANTVGRPTFGAIAATSATPRSARADTARERPASVASTCSTTLALTGSPTRS